MTYTLTASTSVRRDEDGAFIPDDPHNADWQQYQEWLTEGNVPTPYVAPPPQPITLPYLQFRALFTAAENQAIMAAAQSNTAILDWLLRAVGSGLVNLSDPVTKSGLDAAVVSGLITPQRETQILANTPPN